MKTVAKVTADSLVRLRRVADTRSRGNRCVPHYNDKTWYTTNAGQTTDFITAKTTSQNVPA